MCGQTPHGRGGPMIVVSLALLALAPTGCDPTADLGYTTSGFDNYFCRAPDEMESLSEAERELVEQGLSRDQVCNGLRQCPLGDDEEGCADEADVRSDTSDGDSSCTSLEFVCPGTTSCLSSSRVCDGVEDCADGSDEAECGPSLEDDAAGECSDGVDNDGDGTSDCADDDCASLSTCQAAECPEFVFPSGSVAGAQGSTTGRSNDFSGSCGGANGADVSYRWVAPSTGCYELSTAGSAFDTVLIVYQGCGGAELGCNDDDAVAGGDVRTSRLFGTVNAGAELIVVVDGFGVTASGDYQLTIRPSDLCEEQ